MEAYVLSVFAVLTKRHQGPIIARSVMQANIQIPKVLKAYMPVIPALHFPIPTLIALIVSVMQDTSKYLATIKWESAQLV